MARAFKERGGSPPGLLNTTPGLLYQDVFGRIPHQQRLGEAVPPGHSHAQVTLVQRAMDSMGIDYMVVFPTPMLVLGMHPQVEMEVVIGNAFNKWLTEEILPQEPRIKGMLYLPFNHPETALKAVETYADNPSVIGYSVTSTRFRAVHHDSYMPLYSAIQATGKPLAFHSGFHWGDQSMQQCNRFISMHAISFVYYNIIHMTNWIMNGLPERFPRLKLMWIESGLAWIAFLMQRLDSEYMMRSSEAPLLKRRPSEYMAEMYYSSQPLERSNLDLTEATFKAMRAQTQLLFASDWPHWDFDLPNSITTLPFLSEDAKRNILGLNAARLFNLKVPKHKLGGAKSDKNNKSDKGRKAPAVREPVTA
jgi:predicted TIM-barrel fold metal-dependent hydrolase